MFLSNCFYLGEYNRFSNTYFSQIKFGSNHSLFERFCERSVEVECRSSYGMSMLPSLFLSLYINRVHHPARQTNVSVLVFQVNKVQSL